MHVFCGINGLNICSLDELCEKFDEGTQRSSRFVKHRNFLSIDVSDINLYQFKNNYNATKSIQFCIEKNGYQYIA